MKMCRNFLDLLPLAAARSSLNGRNRRRKEKEAGFLLESVGGEKAN